MPTDNQQFNNSGSKFEKASAFLNNVRVTWKLSNGSVLEGVVSIPLKSSKDFLVTDSSGKVRSQLDVTKSHLDKMEPDAIKQTLETIKGSMTLSTESASVTFTGIHSKAVKTPDVAC